MGVYKLPHIRPISDLRNHFADISKLVHETHEPVFLTKNGYGDMVVMSMESYEKKMFESEHYDRLKEEEVVSVTNDKQASKE